MKKQNMTILSIVFLLILIIGGSYAWLSITKTSTKANIITAGNLDLVLDENSTEGISMDELVPVTDEKGRKQEGYIFSLVNRGSINTNYVIYLDDLPLEENEKRMSDDFIKYSLLKNGKEIGSGLLQSIGKSPNRILDSGEISGKTTDKYVLKVWIDSEATNEVGGTVFYSKLRIEVEQNNIHIEKSETVIDPSIPGQKVDLKGKHPEDVEITSNNHDVVKVDSEGNIEIIGPGDAIITIKDKETGEKEEITIYIPKEENINSKDKDSKLDLRGRNPEDLIITSSNENIVQVDSKGNIKVVGSGDVVITIEDKKTGLIEKILIHATLTIDIDPNIPGQKVDLKDKSPEDVEITSSDTNVVEVDSEGNIKVVGPGHATITVIDKETGEKEEIVINSTLPVEVDAGSEKITCNLTENGQTTCEVTLPEITLTEEQKKEGYEIIGWNTNKDAHEGIEPGEKYEIGEGTKLYPIIKKSAITLKAKFNLNGATSLDGEEKDIEKECILKEVYNDEIQDTECNIKTPIIEASITTPKVLGYSNVSDSTTAILEENTELTLTKESTNRNYYAITMSEVKTLTATFSRNGADSLNNENNETIERKCNIPSTYNGEAQESSCTITTPSIESSRNTPNIIGYSTSRDEHTGFIKANREIEITSDVVYYAQTTNNKEIKYTATYQNGLHVTSIARESDSCNIAPSYNGVVRGTTCTVTGPNITPQTGYKAVGFSTTSGATTGEEILILSGNTTYYANAVANSYTIEYYSEGSKVGTTGAKVDEGVTLTTITTLATKTGYTFKGWDTTPSLTTVVYNNTQTVSNLTTTEGEIIKLYAVWVDDVKPTCSFGNANATTTTGTTSIDLTCTDLGVGMNSQNLSATNFTVQNSNGTITAVSTPTAVTNGYKWTLTLRGNSVGTFNITLNSGVIKDRINNTNNASTSGNITVNGIIRTATFVRQGSGVTGIGSNSLSCTTTGENTSCNITLPSITVSSGYTAVGWNTSNTATTGTIVGTSISLSSNPTYYAISYKNAVTRTVSWQGNGASLSGGTSSCTIPVAYNNNAQGTSCNITSPTISRSGFSIVGFNTSSGGTTSGWNSNTTKAVSSNVTYYAITSKTVNITWNANGASLSGGTNSCTIWNSATTCRITSPAISRAYHTAIGFNTSSIATTSSWNQNTAKNVSSNATYYAITKQNYNSNIVSTTNEACLVNKTKGACQAGTSISYKVNASTTKTFYVLHDDGATLTLQQSENTIEDVAWYSEVTDNTKGPLTAIATLESATSGWSNVNTINYTMGTTNFNGTNAYTGCIFSNSGSGYKWNCTTNTYTWPQRSTKARMITAQEAIAVGCTGDSAPSWMSTGSSYWTMSASSELDSRAVSVAAYNDGYLSGSHGFYIKMGVRAVVVISK